LKTEFDLTVKWAHFPLHPETPIEGRPIADLFAGREEVWKNMASRLKDLMVEEGLPYGDRTHTYNSRLAQELGKWAESQPGGEAIHLPLFQKYFVDNLNIGSVDVLVETAREAGLDADAARESLTTRACSDAVDADWQRAMALGLNGVPTFVAGGYGLVGAQSYETLEALVRRALEEPRDLPVV